MSQPENLFVLGARVCAAGRGTDNLTHEHGVVGRITAKLIIVWTDGGGTRRYRRESSGSLLRLSSVPYSPYGGTVLSLACQRKRKS